MAFPADVDGKNRTESEQTLISNLYQCLGKKGLDELHKGRPHLEQRATGYTWVFDARKEAKNLRNLSTTEGRVIASREENT